MKILGNILWLVFGGLEVALGYLVGSIALMLTIIGIPFGIQTMKIGILCLWPFGSNITPAQGSLGCLNIIMNLIWIILGGIWIFLAHIFFGILLCVTIVGIPFGLQHFKLSGLALTPFGRDIRTGI